MDHAVFWERDASSNAYYRLVGHRMELESGNNQLTKVALTAGASNPWIGVAPMTPPSTSGVWLQYFDGDGRPQHSVGIAQAVTGTHIVVATLDTIVKYSLAARTFQTIECERGAEEAFTSLAAGPNGELYVAKYTGKNQLSQIAESVIMKISAEGACAVPAWDVAQTFRCQGRKHHFLVRELPD